VAFNFAPTEVMTLGKLGTVRAMRVGDFYTQPPAAFFNPPRTTPSFPQNLARQTLNGLGRFGRVALGDIPAASPSALTSQSAQPDANSNVPGLTPGSPPLVIQRTEIHRVDISPGTAVALGTLSAASSLVSLYHGYKRNNSLGWGLLWGFMGATFPLITPTVALAQGFAVRKGRR
jgi:hypothetical protein